jgi:hypothetical protein
VRFFSLPSTIGITNVGPSSAFGINASNCIQIISKTSRFIIMESKSIKHHFNPSLKAATSISSPGKELRWYYYSGPTIDFQSTGMMAYFKSSFNFFSNLFWMLFYPNSN